MAKGRLICGQESDRQDAVVCSGSTTRAQTGVRDIAFTMQSLSLGSSPSIFASIFQMGRVNSVEMEFTRSVREGIMSEGLAWLLQWGFHARRLAADRRSRRARIECGAAG